MGIINFAKLLEELKEFKFMKKNNFKITILMLMFLYMAVGLLLMVLPSSAEVYRWNATQKAFWAGTKPVQLVIDTEFSNEVVNRVFEVLEPYPFVLKEKKAIDLSYEPAINEVAVAYASIYNNTGGSFVDAAYRLPNGGLNRGLCVAGTASSVERLAVIMVHEILHSIGSDHGQPWRLGEGVKQPRPLMTSSKPSPVLQHDDLRALSETLRENFLNDTVTVTGTTPLVKGMIINFVNVNDYHDSSQTVPNFTFAGADDTNTNYEIKNLKKGRYYISISPVKITSSIMNVNQVPTTKNTYFHKGKRIINIKSDRVINLDFGGAL